MRGSVAQTRRSDVGPITGSAAAVSWREAGRKRGTRGRRGGPVRTSGHGAKSIDSEERRLRAQAGAKELTPAHPGRPDRGVDPGTSSRRSASIAWSGVIGSGSYSPFEHWSGSDRVGMPGRTADRESTHDV